MWMQATGWMKIRMCTDEKTICGKWMRILKMGGEKLVYAKVDEEMDDWVKEYVMWDSHPRRRKLRSHPPSLPPAVCHHTTLPLPPSPCNLSPYHPTPFPTLTASEGHLLP